MMKVVINRCWGGFGLSLKGQKRLAELQGKEIYFYKQTLYEFKDGVDEYQRINDLQEDGLFIRTSTKDFGEFASGIELNKHYYRDNTERNDLNLIKVIEELGEEVNTQYSKLKIVEIPDDVEWEIDDYDGMESVEEVHRSWN